MLAYICLWTTAFLGATMVPLSTDRQPPDWWIQSAGALLLLMNAAFILFGSYMITSKLKLLPCLADYTGGSVNDRVVS